MPRTKRKAVHFHDVRNNKKREAAIQSKVKVAKPRGVKNVAPAVFSLYGLDVYAVPRKKKTPSYVAVSNRNYPEHEREHAEILAYYHRRGFNPTRKSMWAILEDASMLTRIPTLRRHRKDWSFEQLRDFVKKGKMETFSSMLDFFGALSKHFSTDADYRRALASVVRTKKMAPHIKVLGEVPIGAHAASTYPSKNVRAIAPHLIAVLDFLERRAHALKKKVA